MKHRLLCAAVAAAFALPVAAHAADDKDLAAIRAEIAALKSSYEARIAALEERLKAAEAAPPAAAPAPAPVTSAAPAASNAFNPDIALVLGGTMRNLSQDPATWKMAGFRPVGDETGPGKRGFALGESELTLSANVDPIFSGQLTFSMNGENQLEVEESFVQARALGQGINLRAGRFLSALGYLNSQHAHAWDFVDAPLAYQAFLGGQYKAEGIQLKWLAPTDTLVEVAAEVSSAGRDKNGSGATTFAVHAGDDIGASSSWRAGLSWLGTRVDTLEYAGKSDLLVADAIYKWAPNGNATQQNFKLQGEYLRRKEDSTQSGWYLQGVYQFMPNWRAGLRYDRLAPGTGEHPERTSIMFDYSPSEFSRLRLQLAQDKARGGGTDNQLYLQYIMSLGTHAAHTF